MFDSPEIVSAPSRATAPVTSGLKKTSPSYTSQAARAVAALADVRVVGPVHCAVSCYGISMNPLSLILDFPFGSSGHG
jgi:hypothetical protein